MVKMRLLVWLLTLPFISLGQIVKFSSIAPMQGETVKFIYDPRGGNLEKLNGKIHCAIKAMINRDERVNISVQLTEVNGVYEGEFKPNDSTNLAILIFSAEGTVDENPKGYFTKFYRNGAPTPMALFLEGHLYSGLGNTIAKIKTDQQKALLFYKQAFDRDPKLKEKYFSNYLQAQYILDKAKGEKQIDETVALYNKLEPSEKNLNRIAYLYTIIRNQKAADSVYELIKLKYPKGQYALNALVSSISSIKGAEEKERKLNEILRDFNLDLNHSTDANKVFQVFVSLGIAFLKDKNYQKVEFYIDKIESKTTRAVMYNSFAWKDDVKVNLPFYEKISKKAVDLILSAMNDDESALYYNSKEDYMKLLNNYYLQFKSTYLNVLVIMGRNEEALEVTKDIVVRNNYTDLDLNTKFVSLLIKNNKNGEAMAYAERFVKEGKDGDGLKEVLKPIYKGSADFDSYYANLKAAAAVLQKEEIRKEMVSIEAPNFTLMTLEGKNINLTSLKGKIVIIDYWATWCGPCIASFPAMQMAIDKYKNDPNVVFLFINTWEKEADRVKRLKEWVSANPKYRFTVLLDRESPNDPSSYETIDKYKVKGIPTKFIVDGNGNIRFKKIGFSGSNDGTVKELEIMIEMAKNANGKPERK